VQRVAPPPHPLSPGRGQPLPSAAAGLAARPWVNFSSPARRRPGAPTSPRACRLEEIVELRGNDPFSLLRSPLRPRGAVRRMRRGAGASPVAAALTASGARRCCAGRWRQRAEQRWRHPLAAPQPILWRHRGPSSPVVEQRSRRAPPPSLPTTAAGEPLLPPRGFESGARPPLLCRACPAPSLPPGRARQVVGGGKGTHGGASRSPLDPSGSRGSGSLRENGAGMEETGADIFPGKVYGKRMARGMEETGAGGLILQPPAAVGGLMSGGLVCATAARVWRAFGPS
jgi:hypothetical protein